ncbi:alkaline shock response membrane anchor protein AmaP [Oceanivirga salmonicida]|uniref:alkaline shock response membrane anchor protein AmaP n=1 Tax=Oceanivirga salmonicida TaxID=1769291 RepID=UPI00082E2BFF|nr:alkaline shock response membrane anchor protein AmaP [Oceanivirga salmonicida]
MFKILRFIIHTALLVVAGALLVYLIISPETVKEILGYIASKFDEKVYQLIAIIVLILYFVIFVFSYMETLFSKKNSVTVKTTSGKIEVNFTTLESITKTFLGTKDIVKNVKVAIVPTYNTPKIDADIECYKTENLNEKLEIVKNELKEHITSMVGLKPNSINLKVVKIDTEVAVETIKAEEFIGEEVKQEQE